MRLGVLLLCGSLLPSAAWAQTRASLRAELGAEYDSNATRAETVDGLLPAPTRVVGSPLVRAVLAGDLSGRIGAATDAFLSASVASKAFTESGARSEDVIVGQTTGTLRTGLGRRASLGINGAFFDATQRQSADPRDFRAASGAARLGVRAGQGGMAGLGAGYRWFSFKSDHAFDFQAPNLALDYRHVILSQDESAEWEGAASATFEPRRFEGSQLLACDPPAPLCVRSGPEHRADRFAAGHVELLRVGASLLLGAGYALHVNASNSYGESLLRHVFDGRASVKLPFELYLSAKVEALLTRYQDPIYFGTDPSMRPLSIDDETKDSFRLEATRDFGERWQLVARYTVYTNRIDTRTVHYSRQTVMLGLSFSVER